jgi:ABC-type sugar transport system ATPase subunit
MDLVEPIDLVFENLSYTVTDKVQSKILKKDIKKCILNNLTGYFSHGRLTGIMGPSGAGKTSLMEIISGQSKSGNVTGNLYLNGNPTDINAIKKRAGFVFQDDVILKTMTVKEALYMSALLRLPENISNEEKLNKVNSFTNFIETKIKEGKFLFGQTGFTMWGKKIEQFEKNMKTEDVQDILDLFHSMADSFDKKENSVAEAYCLANIIKINYLFFKINDYDKLYKYIDRFNIIMDGREDEKYVWYEEIKGIIKEIEGDD